MSRTKPRRKHPGVEGFTEQCSTDKPRPIVSPPMLRSTRSILAVRESRPSLKHRPRGSATPSKRLKSSQLKCLDAWYRRYPRIPEPGLLDVSADVCDTYAVPPQLGLEKRTGRTISDITRRQYSGPRYRWALVMTYSRLVGVTLLPPL